MVAVRKKSAPKKKTAKKKVPGKAGRPCLYTDELWARIMDEVASGKSLEAVCRQEGMPTSRALWKWMVKRPELREQFQLAKEIQLELLGEQLIDFVDSLPETPDPSQVAARRLQADTRKWVLSRLLPKKYGDRLAQDVTVTVDHEAVLSRAIERMTKGKSD